MYRKTIGQARATAAATAASRLGLTALALVLSAGVAQAAEDQTVAADAAGADDASGVGEIVVTARYRQESVQDVPIAISSLSAETIEKQGAFNLKQVVQQLPSLNIQGYSGRNQTITIRGIGTNAGGTNDGLEQGVGLYVDGVYRPRTGSVITDLVDIDNIQLLRGPQGTLFGKNTVAGAVDIKTRLPTFDNEVRAEASYGNNDYFRGYVAVNAALSDTLAARVSYLRTSRDGLVYNTKFRENWDNLDNHSARLDILYKPTADFQLRLIADYSIQKGNVGFQIVKEVLPTTLANGTQVRGFYRRAADVGYVPVAAGVTPWQTDIDSSQYDEMPSYGFQATADWNVGPFTLTSITAYRNWKWVPNFDGDQIGANVMVQSIVETDQQQFSQELRLASPGGATIDYTAGLYFFWQEADDYSRQVYGRDAVTWLRTGNTPTAAVSTLPAAIFDGLEARAHVVPATYSYAAYGQATWHVTDRFRLTGGLRFTYEHKTGLYDAVQTGTAVPISAIPPTAGVNYQTLRDGLAPVGAYRDTLNTNNLSGTIIASYDLTPDVHSYASYSRGYKSPGINLVRKSLGVDIFVKPETVDAFELGIKSRFLNGAVELNGALFWTEDRDYQANYVNTSVTPVAGYIGNVGDLRSRGVELDARIAPVRGLSLTFAGTYNEATYRNYTNAVAQYLTSYLGVQDLSGRQAAGTPKWSLSSAVEYVQPVGRSDIYVGADASYKSSFFAAVNLDPFSLVPAYTLLGAHAGVRDADGRWDVSAWVRNLTDKTYFNTVSVNATYGVALASLGEPRVFGLTVRTRF